MKNNILIISFMHCLLGLFACNSKASQKTSQADTSLIKTINPNDILFTTATLSSSLPAFEEKTDSCMFFHEDEWRQIEFISKDQKGAIDKEILKIKDVYDNFSHKSETYTGFKKVAVRDLITQPMSVNFSKLKTYLSDKPIKVKGLGLDNNPGQVKNGFFFAANGINYYGLTDNNSVNTLCIYSVDNEAALKSVIENLSKFMSAENLYLVDWRSMQVYDETTIKSELVKDK